MFSGSIHKRWLAGLGVIAITGLGIAIPGTAFAEVSGPYAGARNISIAKGSNGKVLAVHTSGRELVEPTVTIDVTGLANVATAQFPAACTVVGTKATCPLPAGTFDFNVNVDLKPAPGAVVGTSGTVKYSTTAKNSVGTTATSTVTVGEGVDLWLFQGTLEDLPAKPGDSITAPLIIGNSGDSTVNDVEIAVQYTRGVIPVQYEECDYTESPITHEISAKCRLDGPITPGEVFEIVDEADESVFAAKLSADALGPKAIWFEAFAKGQAPPAPQGTKVSASGAVKSLHMRPKNSKAALADVDSGDNWAAYRWDADNVWDLAAAGATAYGHVGDVITVKLGISNPGAGSFDPWTSGGESYAGFWVKVPAGVSVVEFPSNCDLSDAANQIYGCRSVAYYLLTGNSELFDFKLKIEKETDLTGKVGMGFSEDFGFEDDNAANDTAPLLVIIGSPPPPSGNLPTTGAQVSLLIAGGAVLVAFGAITYRLARRRRFQS